MSKISYTDRQMEAANMLRAVSEKGVPSEVIDEIITMLGDAEQVSTNVPIPKDDIIESIKLKLLDEVDWKKRAALSAMIISKSLEY